MATFRKREKADGSFSHTAYIRIKKGAKVIYTESRTFTKEALAKSWARKRESELEDTIELDAAIAKKLSGVDSKGMLFGELIDQYIQVVKPLSLGVLQKKTFCSW